MFDFGVVQIFIHDQAEFVTAKPGDKQPAILKVGDPTCNLNQQFVADGMTKRIVDRLESVQIDHADQKVSGTRLNPGKTIVKFLQKTPAVGQRRKTIEVGKPVVFVAQPPGLCVLFHQRFLRRDQIGELLIMADQDRDHGQGHKDNVDGDCHEHRLTGGSEEKRHGYDDNTGKQKCRRAQVHQTEYAADDRDRHIEKYVRLLVGISVREQCEGPGNKSDAENGSQGRGSHEQPFRLFYSQAFPSAPPPEHHPGDTHNSQCGGEIHRQIGRSGSEMSVGKRGGVGQENEIQQRYLARKGFRLGKQQLRPVSGNREYSEDL